MQSSDSCRLELQNPEMTQRAGASFAKTLYGAPLDCYLRGPLGAGKTTFLGGFLAALGVDQPVTSPTYALEQRYQSKQVGEVIHIDLYRLEPASAKELVAQSDDHQGIRCIEWAERLGLAADEATGIHLALQDSGDGRSLDVTFHDASFPDDQTVKAWRQDFQLPQNVADHCDAVAALCEKYSRSLLQRGDIIRLKTLRAAALLHDLLRFVDFRPGAGPAGSSSTPEQEKRWSQIRDDYGSGHEEAAARFLTKQGFPAVAQIIRTHGARIVLGPQDTIEQHLLYYADKRVAGETIVSIGERFADFNNRYSGGKETADSEHWRDEALRIEKLLFPEGASV